MPFITIKELVHTHPLFICFQKIFLAVFRNSVHLLVRQRLVHSPTVLAATNFMEAGSLASSSSSGGLVSRGLVGWLLSTGERKNREGKGIESTEVSCTGCVHNRWPS